MYSKETLRKNREATFAMLEQYGKEATTKEAGDEILLKHNCKSGNFHGMLVNGMKIMQKTLHKSKDVDIFAIAKKTGFTPDSVESVVSHHMRGSLDDWNYYPVYDQTHIRNTWGKPLAIAAVNNKTWEFEDILRMDDPEASVIYDEMREEASKRLGIPMMLTGPSETAKSRMIHMTAGNAAVSREIPDNEKPGFMQQESAAKDDNQYE